MDIPKLLLKTKVLSNPVSNLESSSILFLRSYVTASPSAYDPSVSNAVLPTSARHNENTMSV